MDLSVDDIIQIYKDTLCLYNGIPVKVMDVNRDKRIRIFNLLSQKAQWVDFEFEKFSSPKGRLGYVNIMGVCLYIKRQPVRRWSNGLTRNNMSIVTNPLLAARDQEYAVELAKERTHPSFISAMFGVYPSKEEALLMLEKGDKSVAFDRQFAIAKVGKTDLILMYKGVMVGSVEKDGSFVFERKFEYLRNLLETGYGKKDV